MKSISIVSLILMVSLLGNNQFFVRADSHDVVSDMLPKASDLATKKYQNFSWYVFTGGPGTGKTSVLHELASRGYEVVAEAAADVIARELKNGVTAPWAAHWFESEVAKIMLDRQKKLLDKKPKVAFFDRGPLDPHAYISLYNKPVSQDVIVELNQLLCVGNFSKKVFVFQDLGFCQNTEIRHEDLSESKKIEAQLMKEYKTKGFDLIAVPRGTIKERADFILNQISVIG